MRLGLLAVLGTVFALGGCMMMQPPPPQAASCNASGASFVIGQPASPQNVEAARQGAGAAIVRTLRPGQIVTMEFSADRLNLDVNGANVITGARCG